MHIPFGQFKKRVISAVRRDKTRALRVKNMDRKIALGVLLWAIGAVAEADGKFLPEENKKIKEVLLTYLRVSEEDYSIVLTAMRISAVGNINVYKFAKEIGKKLSYKARVKVIEDLFRIGCADKELAKSELGIIKKLSHIFNITDDDFSSAASKVEKESAHR
jgi:uncharacterized tellurite resistance protein B-like protein